jgi:CHAT domain-containing protein
LFSNKIDSTFFKNLEVLTQDISRPNFSSGVHESYRRYTDAAYALYKVLIQPCAGMIRDKSLIIIPDGVLSYLPFETLLTHPVRNDEPDYRNLPYLIRDYDIGYAYSATLHFEVQRSKTRPSGSLLAFAPDYSNVFTQQVPDLSFLEAYREQLIPIPGVKDEVKKISHLIRSDVYLDESATEDNFKKHAADYDILHLAMHTIVDNENPMYSKLAFTQNIDSVEDGFLNTYEIYNMKYNARMAVLSSCKTGYGRLQKGEGVMSLARGFMYAGCPSIIMTLWEVSDKSGVLLMENFYRSLKKGKTKTQALRDAKLEFLRKADQLKANPYFWSTYVSIGDDSSLYAHRSGILWIVVASSLVIAAGTVAIIWYLQIRRKRKKSKGSFRQDTIYT